MARWIVGANAVLEAVAEEGRGVVEIVYPEPFDPAEKQQGWSAASERDASIVDHVGTSGVVLAFDQRDLVGIAERVDVVIELVPQVGDFVARGDPLFRVRSGGRPVETGVLRANDPIGPSGRWSMTAFCLSHPGGHRQQGPVAWGSTIRRPPRWHWIRFTAS